MLGDLYVNENEKTCVVVGQRLGEVWFIKEWKMNHAPVASFYREHSFLRMLSDDELHEHLTFYERGV